MKYIVLLLLGLGLGFVFWVRGAKDDPEQWHVDPLSATRDGKQNRYILRPDGETYQSPVFQMSVAELALAFDKVAMAAPRVSRLAGRAEDLWVTYVQRTGLMRYPDYISVKFIETPDGAATLAIYSRSRFGRSDFGVNRARVKTWIDALG